jgi:hypothetical protein
VDNWPIDVDIFTSERNPITFSRKSLAMTIIMLNANTGDSATEEHSESRYGTSLQFISIGGRVSENN